MLKWRSGKPILFVTLVNSDDIADFKSWWPRFYKRNCLFVPSFGREVARELFQISKFTYFHYSSDYLGVVEARDSYVINFDLLYRIMSHCLNLHRNQLIQNDKFG